MRDLITLLRQVSPLVGVRAWHNTTPRAFGGASAHEAIEIAWYERGTPHEYVVGSHRYAPGVDSAMVVPSRMEHYTSLAPGGQAKVLSLSPSVVEQVADAMTGKLALRPMLTAGRPRVLRLCNLMFEEAIEQTPGHELAVDALVEALAVELLRAGGGGPAAPAPRHEVRDPRIRRALAFIDSCFAEPLTLESIARAAGMSRFHFGRVFEAQVGKSPYRYLLDLRVERAAALLGAGRVSVTEAAISVGFNDLGRFGKAFRARYGRTPREALAASRGRAPRRAHAATPPAEEPSGVIALPAARIA